MLINKTYKELGFKTEYKLKIWDSENKIWKNHTIDLKSKVVDLIYCIENKEFIIIFEPTYTTKIFSIEINKDSNKLFYGKIKNIHKKVMENNNENN